MITPLTNTQGQSIITAIRKLRELEANAVSTANNDSEKVGLKQFIQNELFAHADEFLGCWIAVKAEYEPLVTAVTAILRRATQINQQQEETKQ